MILAIIQARMSSTRLPGKVMKPVLGKPLIDFPLERLVQSKRIGRLLVASTVNRADDSLCIHLQQRKVEFFRGSEEDVLDRYYHAALCYRPEIVVRITSDCPLMDPQVVDGTIDFFNEGSFDYVSNVLEFPVYPKGMDVEVFKFEALERAWKEARLPSEREHVTSYLYKKENQSKVSIGCFHPSRDYSRERWTVDRQEDFVLIRRILEALYPLNPLFTMEDILCYQRENPKLFEINRHIPRDEGYRKSLLKDGQTKLVA